MLADDLSQILESKNISILDNVDFKSESEKLDFLNKLEILLKRNVDLKYINNDIIQIIIQINFEDKTIETFRKINWQDFNELFLLKDKNLRDKRIYYNFLNFLKSELGIFVDEKPLIDKTLTGDESSDKYFSNMDSSIFKIKENFNVQEDLNQKAKKFNIDILFDYNEPSKKITVNDFVLYFNKRLEYFTDLLKSRVNMDNVMRISQLRDLFETNTDVSLIGLISDIKETKNGHYMITIQDKSGEISCFVNKDKKDLIKLIELFCLDEGVGIVGKVGKNIIWTEDIVIPSPPNESELKQTEKEEYVVMISDLHFGAKVFVDEAFQKFLDWLNGETSNEKLNKIAKKIKYILVAGDIIEGIGIYPNQGKDSRILSAELQYHEAARWLSQIPKDKCIIIIPGNHETTRLSEPQPKLDYNMTYPLYNMENVVMLSNPSRIRLFENDPSAGLEFYMYHGGSLFYYADSIKYLREQGGAKKPEEVVKYLLEKRHIAPSHGATLYIPDNQNDPLVIKKMPDFFITGHTHKMSIANYKGCSIFSCGCWVEMSDYQEKMGMFPDIGKCILINTKTRKPQILNFYTNKEE